MEIDLTKEDHSQKINITKGSTQVNLDNAIAAAREARDTAETHKDSAATSASSATSSASTATAQATIATTKASEASSSATSASTSATTATTKASEASTSATNASTSETNASTSETNAAIYMNNALDYATDASLSETNAAGSATSASASATSASTSATSASGSATTATTQAGIATTKASEASTSATNAATSETNAGVSATTATTKAGEASTSATSAAGSATSASTSATNAATSETNASNSATSASTSATNASTSETNASTSATNASTSATSAANSATASANSATEAASYSADQTGNAGKFLQTNGSVVSWQDVDALPDQTGHNGQFLTTNGTTADWADVVGAEHYDQETEPTPQAVGATWYVPSTAHLYKYVEESGNFFWIDISTAGAGVSQSYVDAADALKLDHENTIYTSGGNVGIGTSSPTEKLHVSGNAKASNYFFTDGSTIKRLYTPHMYTYHDGSTYRNTPIKLFTMPSPGSGSVFFKIHRKGDFNYAGQTIILEGHVTVWSNTETVYDYRVTSKPGYSTHYCYLAIDSSRNVYYYDAMLWSQETIVEAYTTGGNIVYHMTSNNDYHSVTRPWQTITDGATLEREAVWGS